MSATRSTLIPRIAVAARFCLVVGDAVGDKAWREREERDEQQEQQVEAHEDPVDAVQIVGKWRYARATAPIVAKLGPPLSP